MAIVPYLQVEDLTKSYGDRMILDTVSFGVNEGDKIGIIAKNGTGKSTLLSIIAGDEDYDSGKITLRNGLRVGYLPQSPDVPQTLTAIDACIAMTVGDDLHGDLRERAERILTQLGVVDVNADVAHLSGGQRKRVAMAAVIASEPDLLLLDEPTNHLDIDVIEWIEGWLKKQRVTLLMVTHDRYFLDRVCNQILEIDRQQIYSYNGNYDYYIRRRQERLEALSSEHARLKNLLRREQEWINRTPSARTGKARYRINAFHDLKDRASVNLSEREVNLNVKSSYIGSKIFVAHNISKRFDDKVILDNFNYTFARYDRLGIIGPNGIGKTTFIRMLQGFIKPDSGYFEIGETVRFGYYSQEGINFDNRKKVIDAVNEIAEDIVVNDNVHYSPLQFLQYFLFTPADQQKYIAKLSGGERCRLHLATVLMRSPNFLILDEPTNDLDIITLSLLEEYLLEFKGCLIVISHDRYFLDRIVDHVFVFHGNGNVEDFPGNFSQYRAKQAEKPKEVTTEKKENKPQREKADRPVRMTFKERKEFEELTEELDALNAEKAELEAIFNSGEQIADIAERSRRYDELRAIIDEKEFRWLELSEKS